ncbi:hypothetical protein FRB98_005486 [Tulasnella sp. 332]|nr:hypothetical protein FRB98_005486 [Tulasnella sp. 332]
MIPGLALLYGGLARRKNALALMWVVVASNAVVIFQWYFWGYSLAFSGSASSGYIGNLSHIGLKNVMAGPSPGSPLIPELLYAFYQLQVAAVTVAILMGAVADRGRVMPAMIVTFFWMTLVYAPVACWAWSANGWAFKWGVLDFAGGGPVELGSGVGGLAYSFMLGRRSQKELVNFRPHNVSLVCLGTFLLWFGWIGFNAGSASGANLRAVVAAWNTGLCAAMAGIMWCLIDYKYNRKYTMVGFCSGTIAGLVAATSSSGLIPPWASVILGLFTGVACNYATKIKHWVRVDDALDLFDQHGVAGAIGLIFNGIFAADYIISLDDVNTSVKGGFMQRNFKQLYIQVVYVITVAVYVFIVTASICKVVDMIPGCHLRCSDEAEQVGMDEADIGEFVADFVEVQRAFDTITMLGSPVVDYSEKPNALQAPPPIVAAGDRHGGVTDVGSRNSAAIPHNESQMSLPSETNRYSIRRL